VKLAWTLGIFVALLALLAVGLGLNPREVPSPLIGKPAPAFELPLLSAPDKILLAEGHARQGVGAERLGVVVRAVPRRASADHAARRERAAGGRPQLQGLREDALPWLARNGNPFAARLYDSAGRIAIDYGVYGVPETYVIDRKGVIRYKRIGPVTPEILKEKIEPLLREAEW
jgi:cytochrome c biogenesis protein CcmG/thiol:disulfide interchange protein DsbE